MGNEYSWNLDTISHSAHYSKNWDVVKQAAYNSWYYENVTKKKKDSAKSTLNEEDVNEHYGPEDQSLEAIMEESSGKPTIDQGDSARSIYEDEEKEETKQSSTENTKKLKDTTDTVNDMLNKYGHRTF